ncbi:MAG: Gfo/Idh/MocA family oxidoreductase [Clostridia bacterium]|nr:Gfo/Idh/MocA family oxidoreductase [Clostridia bacterium]
MKEFNVGVIGCGAISGNHFHGIKKAENACLRAVCDIDESKLKKSMEAQNVDGYTDYHDLLTRPDIDAVHICVPHYLHAPISIAALEAGKHVLCEKPMGMTLGEAQAMKRAAEASGKTLTICFQNRYNGASLRMKEIIDGGELGRVIGGSAFVCWDRDEAYYASCPWRGAWKTEGGSVLINQAIHTLDLMRWLAGGFELRHATMTAKRLADVIETEDTCDMLLENSAGGRFIFFCTDCAATNENIYLHLTLEKGEMHMDGARLTIITVDGAKLEDYSTGKGVGKDYWGDGHDRFIADFYRRLGDGLPPFVTAEDALETTRLMDAAYHGNAPIRSRKD